MERLNTIQKTLEARGVMPKGPPNLTKMQLGLERILSPHSFTPFSTVVVAGTNGKGSVCATLEALLLEAGQSVGVYTSPHLEQLNERFRIQGKLISSELLCEIFFEVDEKTKDLSLSHFETLTLMAAGLFYSHKLPSPPHWKIFEVGMGGTWDATNAIPHHFSVITALGYDHEEFLGSTLEEIASNKFGIVSPHGCVIHSPLPSSVQEQAEKVQLQTQSQWHKAIPYRLEIIPPLPPSFGASPQFVLHTEYGSTQLALAGRRGAENSATALTVFRELGFDPAAYLHALTQVNWPGRMEKIPFPSAPCPVYLSGDHNPQGVDSLLELLADYPRKHLHVLLGIGKDKDYQTMLQKLQRLPHTSFYLTLTPFKGRALEEYGDWLKQAAAAHPHPLQALEEICRRAHPQDLILVTGSLYLVGAIRSAASKLSSPSSSP